MSKQPHSGYPGFLDSLQACTLRNIILNWLRKHCLVEMTSPYERNYCSYLEKCTERAFLAIIFLWGSRIPQKDRPQWNLIVVSSTNGFHSINFFPCQRPPQTVSAPVAGGFAMCKPCRCVWELLRSKADATPPPFPPWPHVPQSSLEWGLSPRPAVCWLWGPRRSSSSQLGMFPVSWGCPSCNV